MTQAASTPSSDRGGLAFALLRLSTYSIGLLPYCLLHLMADFVALVTYYLLRYRRRVVHTNLCAAYPDKSLAEIRKIERRFYRHFARQSFDSFKFSTLSADQALEHMSLGNTELLTALRKRGARVVCVLMGHYGSWDSFTVAPILLKPLGYDLHQIYRPLKSKAVDRLMKVVRERFGSDGIPKDETGRRVLSLYRGFCEGDNTAIIAFIADQTPSPRNVHLWTPFLRQPSAFFTGAERLAAKLDLPLLYLDVRRISSTRYHGEFVLLAEHPSHHTPLALTRRYAALMEQTIDRDPAYWLWTHRRWKLSQADYLTPPIHPQQEDYDKL